MAGLANQPVLARQKSPAIFFSSAFRSVKHSSALGEHCQESSLDLRMQFLKENLGISYQAGEFFEGRVDRRPCQGLLILYHRHPPIQRLVMLNALLLMVKTHVVIAGGELFIRAGHSQMMIASFLSSKTNPVIFLLSSRSLVQFYLLSFSHTHTSVLAYICHLEDYEVIKL